MSIQIEETGIPVHDEVKGACELLGLDPLYAANEGKLDGDCRAGGGGWHRHGHARPRRVGAQRHRNGWPSTCTVVSMKTAFGSTRIVDLLVGDQLPHIC